MKGGSEVERIDVWQDSGRFRTGGATKRSAAGLDSTGFEVLPRRLEHGETFRKERTAQNETAKAAAAKRGRRERKSRTLSRLLRQTRVYEARRLVSTSLSH